ncbi:MAG: phosphoadenylyl-sulfate reductase [Verrucomicrobiota bacterium]|nr:phosphoadenylyl-sulfate reductase [Verrucomicrobiota bacterium]
MKTEMDAKSGIKEDVAALNEHLHSLDAAGRIELLAEKFSGRIVATTSFGLQAAVMLKLLRDHAPRIPVVFIDTGYLFAETYRYAALLQEELGFEARVYSPLVTAARQEALHGREWEGGTDGMNNYARIHKVEPMNRALQELGADVWLSGLRRAQSSGRSQREIAEKQARTLKSYPIIDWDDGKVERFMRDHRLPCHPLASAGYVTMGDWHSTSPGSESSRESTRFNGEKYECGLHLNSGQQDFQI